MAMTDEQSARLLYRRMYRYMITKDSMPLTKMLTDDFTFTHEIGVTQNKEQFVQSIAAGVLHLFSEYTIDVEVELGDNEAVVRGKSRVTAAWFEIERKPWNFELTLNVRNTDVGWQVAGANLATFEA